MWGWRRGIQECGTAGGIKTRGPHRGLMTKMVMMRMRMVRLTTLMMMMMATLMMVMMMNQFGGI